MAKKAITDAVQVKKNYRAVDFFFKIQTGQKFPEVRRTKQEQITQSSDKSEKNNEL